jgi:hypothetical protein
MRLVPSLAAGTNKAFWPTQLLKVAPAGLLIREPVQELIPVTRIVATRDEIT